MGVNSRWDRENRVVGEIIQGIVDREGGIRVLRGT
jgi:hypothetical protein